MVAKNLIILAIPLLIRPKVIRAIGPIPPIIVITVPMAFLIPSGRLLNASSILVPNSIIGVAMSRKTFPIGARASLIFSTAERNLFIEEAAETPSSPSDRAASSSTEDPANSRTRDAWVPSLATLAKRVDRRAN